ncbi:hypothetical protein FLONG3_6897 [Fusarium longipes]|uniref:Uncharacterized protein n=1 Tax=Fusarium longipes TaxID=694270 RepID=A0A395SHW2_9HYPO|nr:hypothetical protein FLONG3_6897 [Fusarium longipes]
MSDSQSPRKSDDPNSPSPSCPASSAPGQLGNSPSVDKPAVVNTPIDQDPVGETTSDVPAKNNDGKTTKSRAPVVVLGFHGKITFPEDPMEDVIARRGREMLFY